MYIGNSSNYNTAETEIRLEKIFRESSALYGASHIFSISYVDENNCAIAYVPSRKEIYTSIKVFDDGNDVIDIRDTLDANSPYQSCIATDIISNYFNHPVFINPIYDDMYKKYIKPNFGIFQGAYLVDNDSKNHWIVEMREILDCMLEELIAIASRDNPSPLQKKEASRNFLNAITDTEKRALHYLKENLPADGHGQILISKAVAETGISRTAYTNLFNKMIKYNVADVNNGGVKGTNIYVYVKSILK